MEHDGGIEAEGELILIVTLEKPAPAHIRWFVDKGEHVGEHFPVDSINLLIITGAIFFIALAFAIDNTSWSHKFNAISEKAYGLFPQGGEWRIIASFLGVLFIINSITGVFLASHLVLPSEGLVIFGGITQMVIGLVLVSQISFSVAGFLILLVAVPLAAIYLPITLIVDYLFEFVALGLALIFTGISACYLDQLGCQLMKRDPTRFSRLPVPIMRIGVGLSLIVLAIHNKLISPNLALTFLDEHPLNFMAYLGFTGFTNTHFVFAAGVAEFTLGVLLVAGIATRFVTAAMSTVLLSSMVYFGPAELIGHLPIFGIALLLFIQGSGAYRLASRDATASGQIAKG